MRFDLQITGSMAAITAAELRAGERAVTQSMAAVGLSVQSGWRDQIMQSGLGSRLSSSIRYQVYPKGQNSLNAAALIYSKAPKIIHAHEGTVVKSQNGYWLAIPLPAAGRGSRGARITPGQWEARTGRRLAFIYKNGRSALLVDVGNVVKFNYMTKAGFHKRRGPGRKNVSNPIFALVSQVRLPRRLNVASVATAAAARLPGLIVANWRNA